MSEIRLTGRLICADSDEARIVLDHLPVHVALTRAETGCLSFDVSQTTDPLVWQVDELFENEAAFTAHQNRVADSDWGRATAGITRRYSIDGLRD
ncbi:putative quinol monooxygenase [Agreia sp. COWG]|uniref:putative quinol monooxygenase n=1 Tax=Agreia sp. COWG TaxID=2773266 RepID=UPI001925FF15|nr:antibiotic biosynthesis monooxygenase [Agreia sp. COWG]CAD6010530.1 Antibiotic biosynthesis monooxygenase [Agreia sp. COWG]